MLDGTVMVATAPGIPTKGVLLNTGSFQAGSAGRTTARARGQQTWGMYGGERGFLAAAMRAWPCDAPRLMMPARARCLPICQPDGEAPLVHLVLGSPHNVHQRRHLEPPPLEQPALRIDACQQAARRLRGGGRTGSRSGVSSERQSRQPCRQGRQASTRAQQPPARYRTAQHRSLHPPGAPSQAQELKGLHPLPTHTHPSTHPPTIRSEKSTLTAVPSASACAISDPICTRRKGGEDERRRVMQHEVAHARRHLARPPIGCLAARHAARHTVRPRTFSGSIVTNRPAWAGPARQGYKGACAAQLAKIQCAEQRAWCKEVGFPPK